MNRELKLAIEQVGREKGIATEVLFEALESALLSASKRTMGVGDNTRLTLDRETGAIRVFAEKRVVEKVADPKLEMSLDEARRLKPGAQLEDVVEIDLEMKELGRIAAQTAKQVILQRVREAERQGIFSEYKDREGTLVRALVHRIEKRTVILDMGRTEAVLPEREQIPGERYMAGDRVRAYIMEVRNTPKGPQVVLPRGAPHLDDPLGDLRDLGLEEPDQEARMRAREHDLRALGRVPDLQHVGAHAIPGLYRSPGICSRSGRTASALPMLQDDVRFSIRWTSAAHDVPLAVLELREDALALGVADALQDHLLGGLGGDAAELLHLELELDRVLELGARR